MGFHTGAIGTLWVVNNKGKYSDVQLSIDVKNKQTGGYDKDFNGYVRFIGDAHRDVQGLVKGAKIKIGDCDVSQVYDKEKDRTYTNFKIFSFTGYEPGKNTGSTPEAAPSQPASAGTQGTPDSPAYNEDDDLPF